MKLTISATFDGKVFVPDGPVVEFPAGTAVTLTAEGVKPSGRPAKIAPQGENESLADFAERIAVDCPDLPADYSAQLDHYLYGTPKR